MISEKNSEFEQSRIDRLVAENEHWIRSHNGMIEYLQVMAKQIEAYKNLLVDIKLQNENLKQRVQHLNKKI